MRVLPPLAKYSYNSSIIAVRRATVVAYVSWCLYSSVCCRNVGDLGKLWGEHLGMGCFEDVNRTSASDRTAVSIVLSVSVCVCVCLCVSLCVRLVTRPSGVSCRRCFPYDENVDATLRGKCRTRCTRKYDLRMM